MPKEVAESWLKYLREELPTVAFKCSTQKQANNLKQRREKGGKTRKQIPVTSATQMSESLGAETLLQLLKNYSRNLDIKTAITVGKIILRLTHSNQQFGLQFTKEILKLEIIGTVRTLHETFLLRSKNLYRHLVSF